jgi:glyoxylase-like metal-dependent hydrolase (beta-lactamase superfamily II)
MNIYDQSGITVDIYPLGPLGSGTNVGIIANGNNGIVIDAPPDAAREILSVAKNRGLHLQYLFITHCHWDHITDASLLRKHGLKVYAHELDRQVMENPEQIVPEMRAYWHINECSVDYVVKDGEIFSICGLRVQAFWVPGHTPGGMAYFFGDLGICFVGDTLFARTVGRSDLPGGDKHILFKSIREKLYILPEATVIIPGHGHLTTVGEEREENPYIRPRG